MPADLIAKAREVFRPTRARTYRRAFAAGVNVDFGTDAGVYPHGENAQEFAVMVKLGLTPLQAIQAATSTDAEPLGWATRWARSSRGNRPTSLPWTATRWPTSQLSNE